ncbi:Uncharacterised protein [Nocardia otitidiscaviarum]|uniref:Uncharacterized protein n=1 Tax=Nocardia otitidiscaviarum TaxID=1823 RepID=A0A379JL66_9NOCA|nr:Uncharacterised protein [Nocardia otitidiscaviarum]
MSDSVWDIKALFGSLLACPDGWGASEFAPWFEQRPQLRAALHECGAPDAHRSPIPPERRWQLYGVSRLVDILLVPHQPHYMESAYLGAAPTAWSDFTAMIGAVPISENEFHPFFHEIVDVIVADDPREPVTIAQQHWPGAFLGNLLLVRSGVTVRAGSSILDPHSAARSSMYWTFWRCYRKVQDLSNGWGSNSQWRASFRRDYCIDGELRYNIDARWEGDPAPAGDDLTPRERLDLLRFRHGVLRDLGTERWPYDDHHVERWRP